MLLLLFLVSYSISDTSSKCVDQSEFCQYVKSLCNSRDNGPHITARCPLTCGICKKEVVAKEELSKVILPPNITNVKGRPSEEEPLLTTTPKKCVFPKEKMLTTITPNKTEYTFSANLSVVHKKDETIQTVVVQISNSTRSKTVVSDSKEVLKKVAEARRNQSAFDNEEKKKEEIYHTMKKVKLSKLTSEQEFSMPRITTADPSKFSISLSKTLIKGKCFDEYMYCKEFSSLCTHPSFGDVMASHCTLTCQRCEDVDQEDEKERDNCIDTASATECQKYLDVCHDNRFIRVTNEFCAKSCGHCKPRCRDRHQNCAQFVKDGFCSDEMYTIDERSYLCGESCGSC